MPTARLPAFADTRPDARLDTLLRRTVLLGALAVAALPAARDHTAWFGWLPLWLLAMPLASWWALHRFQLPRWRRAGGPRTRRRARGTQARRQPAMRGRVRMPRAA